MKKVYFRIDSSAKIGSGHLYRCLVLANTFKSHNIECIFLCKNLPGNYNYLVTRSDHALIELDSNFDEQQDAIFCSENTDHDSLLIIDHYSLTDKFVNFLSKNIIIFRIDDHSNSELSCDFFLDQNLRVDYSQLQQNYRKCRKAFLGPEYALIRNDFSPFRDIEKNFQYTSQIKVLAYFGGGDHSFSAKKLALEFLKSNRNDIVLNLVVSRNCLDFINEFRNFEARNLRIIISPLNFEQLLSESHLYIGSGGSISLERMYLGVPGITIAIAENQVELSNAMAKINIGEFLGYATDNSFKEMISKMYMYADDRKQLENISNKMKSMVDGQGANRIVTFLITELALLN